MVNMNDIAKAIGVSRPVVSSVFSSRATGTVRVSEKTRDRVLEIARQMGYRPNHIARSVATGKTRVIAFVGSVMRFDFAMETLSGVMAEAEKQGYVVKVMQAPDQGWSSRDIADTLIGRRVDGVIFFHMEQNTWDDLIGEIDGKIPAVALSCVVTQGSLVSINSDNLQAYEQIINHLVELGHHRIAMIGGLETSINERTQEFVQVMKQQNLLVESWTVQRGDWQLDKTEQVTRDLLSRPAGERPTAICCASDGMAMAVLRTARSMGFDVPTKLSVVGFGETNVARMADPPLTTVDQSYQKMGKLACEKLLDNLEGRDAESVCDGINFRQRIVPTRLQIRQSTATVQND